MRALIITDFHRGYNQTIAKIQEKALNNLAQSKTKFDIIIVSGDWGTSKVEHVKGAFSFLRKTFPKKIICGVLGNHDLWDKKHTLSQTLNKISQYAKESNIHLLENNPLELSDYTILGFNSWFNGYDFQHQQDYSWMKISSQQYFLEICKKLNEDEEKAVNFICQYPTTKKKIIISHMPIFENYFEKDHKYAITKDPAGNETHNYDKWASNPKYGNQLLPIMDYHIFGHTHTPVYDKINNTIIINAGAEYGKVKYIIYDFNWNTIIDQI